MMPPDPQTCPCWADHDKGRSLALKVAPSASLSLLIAFFPKCPVCWAVYMSLFGGLGLAKLPYLGWLWPVLLSFMALHLLLLFRSALRRGYYWPFAASFAGSTVIVCGRTYACDDPWILGVGVALIVTGSIFNGLADIRSFKKL